MEDTKTSREGDRQRHREGGDMHRDIERWERHIYIEGEIDRNTDRQTDRQTHTHTHTHTHGVGLQL